MNLEHKDQNQSQNEIKIGSSQLLDLFLGNYLPSNLKENIIPSFIESMVQILDKDKVQIGGSAMEIASGLIKPNEYWETKSQLKKIQTEIDPNIDQKERTVFILGALETLANNEPDFDFYVPKKESLTKIFKHIDQNDKNLIASYGPIYEGSLFYRINLKFVNDHQKSLFHIDITALPETGDDQTQNRRHFIGDIHDSCRGKLSNLDSKTEIEFDQQKIPNPNNPSIMTLDKKDLKASYEIVLREMRKKIMHFTSVGNFKRNEFSLSKIFPLMDVENIFSLREMAFGQDSRSQELFEKQNSYQKQMLYQELFLMAQTDPYLTTVFLQDTGIDTLFFGRHLARREVLGLLSSEYLNFLPTNTEEKLSQRLKKSRENYLNLKGDDQKKNGLKRFISAIGQILGEDREKQNFEVHFKNGLEILGDPKSKVKELPHLTPNRTLNEKEQEMLKQLNLGGGLTEKGLNHILNQVNSEKYPHQSEKDRKFFRKTLLELKKTGLIETAKRTINVPEGEMEAWFYYPCLASTKIEKVLFDAGRNKIESNLIETAYRSIGVNSLEAILSIKTKELSESNFWDRIMSLVHPHLILKLITWQSEIETRQNTHNYLDFRKNK